MPTKLSGGSESELQAEIEKLTYEQAFCELETIVEALESDKSSLDESLALFERGQALARYCSSLLESAELKVQKLSDGTLVDFNPPD